LTETEPEGEMEPPEPAVAVIVGVTTKMAEAELVLASVAEMVLLPAVKDGTTNVAVNDPLLLVVTVLGVVVIVFALNVTVIV
jgi:hypothetical protein